jgi:hypothetical protein
VKYKVVFAGIFALSFVLAKDSKPRKVAEEIPVCIPLGKPLEIPSEAGYTAEELNLLKNSIFAQYGFKFKDKKIEDEMVKRGCQKDNVAFDARKIDPIDRKNAAELSSMEDDSRFRDPAGAFKKDWSNSMGNPKKRRDLISRSYCFLSDSNDKYFGIVYFGTEKAKRGFSLKGMMDLANPTWIGYVNPADEQDEESRAMQAEESKRLASKVFDTTAIHSLDFQTNGSWTVNSTKSDKAGLIQITMNTKHKNMKNAFLDIDTDGYNTTNILNCKLVE